MARIDRQYFKRRALQEIDCSKHAGPIEAKIAHAKLAGLHVRRCASFEAHQTPECLGCPLAFICNYRPEVADGSLVDRGAPRGARILNLRQHR